MKIKRTMRLYAVFTENIDVKIMKRIPLKGKSEWDKSDIPCGK